MGVDGFFLGASSRTMVAGKRMCQRDWIKKQEAGEAI